MACGHKKGSRIILESIRVKNPPVSRQHPPEKERLLEDIGVLDKEFEKRPDFINVLDKLKAILYKLLSMIPLVSKGEVVPVYEDYNGRGTEYQLAGDT